MHSLLTQLGAEVIGLNLEPTGMYSCEEGREERGEVRG